MVVVSAFGTLNGTQNAGMVAYYRAPDCDSVTIADLLPILSKIDYYENEYIIGEILLWDSYNDVLGGYNNCTKVRVIIYNDGWICAWFDKTTQNQLAIGGAAYVDEQTLSGWGNAINYHRELNGMVAEISSSTDPECPTGTRFTIRDSDNVTGEILVHHYQGTDAYHFNSGYVYNVDIYMSNGKMFWPNSTTGYYKIPDPNSNTLYRAIMLVWAAVKDSSNTSRYTETNASLIYMYDYTVDTYTDETTNFNSSVVSDCQVFPTNEVLNDAFYIGSETKFNGVNIIMGTPGVGSGVTWEYWNSSVWVALTCVDGTTGFTSTGDITFVPPDDWAEAAVNGQNYYWIRARVTTASYTVTPLITRGQVRVPSDIPDFWDTGLGLYNFEFLSANYVLICGGLGNSTYYTYFYATVLPGKTIYDFSSSYAAAHPHVYGWYVNNHIMYSTNNPVLNATYGYIVHDLMDVIPSVGTQVVSYTHEGGSYKNNIAAFIIVVS